MKNNLIESAILLMLLFCGINSFAQTKVEYIEDNSVFPNPERGYFSTSTPPWPIGGVSTEDWENSISGWTPPISTSMMSENRANGISLHAMRYHIAMFRNSPLSQEFLDRIDADAEMARQSGVKLNIRFVYSWLGCRPDATKDRIVEHLGQLKDYFAKNADVIAFVEAGLVGCWGEWHDSQNGLLDNPWGFNINAKSRAILDALFLNVPSDIMINFRYPTQKMQYFHPNYIGNYENDPTPVPSSSDAYSGSNAGRAGYYCDSFRSDDSDGTWHSGDASRVKNESKYAWMEGEMDPGFGNTATNLTDHNTTRKKLKDFHWSALNLSQDFSSSTYKTNWSTDGFFTEVNKNLGYRLRLDSSSIDNTVVQGDSLHLVINLTNIGYASLYNKRNLEIILRNKTTGTKSVTIVTNENDTTTDPRYWYPGSHKLKIAVQVLTNAIPGNYDVLLNLPDRHTSIHNRPEYSIRLANNGTWEDSTGYNSLLQTITVMSSNTKVTGVVVSPKIALVDVGGTTSVSASVEPLNASNDSVYWSSSDNAIATVNSNGIVTGVAEGKAKIIAITADGEKTDTCEITSTYISLTGVAVSPKTASVDVGSKTNITVLFEPSNASNKSVLWESRNAGIAEVSADGEVTGLSVGTTKIIVTSIENNKSDSCEITVESVRVIDVTVNPAAAFVAIDATVQLTATINPVNATNKLLIWSSSNNSIAMVDEFGVVTGKSAGVDTITVTSDDNGQSDTCIVTVTVSDNGNITAVKIYPRSGWAQRIAGAKIQTSNDFTNWTDLYTITAGEIPANNTWATYNISTTVNWRYFRYLSPKGGWGNLAELEFYDKDMKITGITFGTAGSYENSGATFDKVFDGNVATFFDAPVGNGVYMGIDKDSPVSINEISKNNNDVIIFPNPGNGKLLMISGIQGNTVISITDLDGRKVFQQELDLFGSQLIKGINLKQGIYIAVIKSDNKLYTSKLIVE